MLSVRMGPSCGFLVIAIVVIPPPVVPEVLGLAVALLALLPLPQPASATRAARPAGRAASASRVLIILVSLVFGQGARTIGLSQRPPSANRARFRPPAALDSSCMECVGLVGGRQIRRIDMCP